MCEPKKAKEGPDRPTMSDQGEDIYWECVICHGTRKRSRNGENGMRCKHNNCKHEYARRRAEDRAAKQPSVGDEPVDSDPTQCFKIKEVIGVSQCLKMTKTEKTP